MTPSPFFKMTIPVTDALRNDDIIVIVISHSLEIAFSVISVDILKIIILAPWHKFFAVQIISQIL